MIEDSNLSSASKEKICDVIDDATKDFGIVKSEVALIIAEETNADLDAFGAPPIEANDPEIASLGKELDAAREAAGKELEDDLTLLGETLDSLGNLSEGVQTKALEESLQK